ncbi:LacI family DNA-binding transcriptional regulator [Scopulibacillus cellulosilyticus]|uniref:LacI family DNA-binding transcriptional regulator n=1 Tax=Scopulibacillus cellulosilyticus TaxID=2665665 RepID=A0ABW2Q094_9BACL
MSVTIKDVARVAGVSYSTVSKALNNSPLVKEKTKIKILQAAKQLGYQPNFAAKSLVSKKSSIIGVVWPTVERMAWSALATNINDALVKKSYNMLLSINPLASAISIFNQFRVDGILVFQEERTLLESTDIKSTVPILFYGESGSSHYPEINVNRRKAIFEAVRYLAEMGHRRIAYIGDLSHKEANQQEKLIGFSEGIMQFGLVSHPDMAVHVKKLSWEEGFRATKQLLQSSYRPTAIVSASYDLSAGIIRAVRDASLRIPIDISLISYDNIPQMAGLEIPLTAVGTPVDKLAENLVEALLKIIEHPDSIHPFDDIDIELNERASCGPPLK